MIIHDFNLHRTGQCPAKANAKLIVYANAVLAGTISMQQFKPVAWRYAKIVKPFGNLQLSQLAPCDGLDVCKSSHTAPGRHCFGVAILK